MSNEELLEKCRAENRNLELKIEELQEHINTIVEKGTYEEGYDAGFDDGSDMRGTKEY